MTEVLAAVGSSGHRAGGGASTPSKRRRSLMFGVLAAFGLAALVSAGYLIALGILAVTTEAAVAAVFFAGWVVGGCWLATRR